MAGIYFLQPDPTAGKDTNVNSGSPSSNYATSTSIQLNGSRIGLIQFDLFGSSPKITLGSTIRSAYLELYLYSTVNSGTQPLDVRFVTSSWIETVTYNTKPTWEATGITANFPKVAGTWVKLDITSIVQRWSNGEVNNGVALVSAMANDNYYTSDYTTNTALRPKITVDYVLPGEILAPVTNATVTARNPNPTIIAAPVTMQVTALAQRYSLSFDDGQGWEDASASGTYTNPINLGQMMIGEETSPIKLALHTFLTPGQYTLLLTAGGFNPKDICFALDNNGVPGVWSNWGGSMSLPIANNQGYNTFFVKVRAQQGEQSNSADRSINIIVSM